MTNKPGEFEPTKEYLEKAQELLEGAKGKPLEAIRAVALALSTAKAEQREESAKIIDAKVKQHDEDNSCRESMWCECFGYSTLEDLATAIRRNGKP